jgi:hypothetical protein
MQDGWNRREVLFDGVRRVGSGCGGDDAARAGPGHGTVVDWHGTRKDQGTAECDRQPSPHLFLALQDRP